MSMRDLLTRDVIRDSIDLFGEHSMCCFKPANRERNSIVLVAYAKGNPVEHICNATGLARSNINNIIDAYLLANYRTYRERTSDGRKNDRVA